MSLRSFVLGSVMLGAFASSVSCANQVVPVVEKSRNASAPEKSAQAAPAQTTQWLYQLETLQQEVQTLRGMVEEQAYQIEQMREEQRDRYLDLDRRITRLRAGASATAASATGTESNQATAPTATAATTPGADSATAVTPVTPVTPEADKSGEAYQSAFALVRNKEYSKAVAAFEQLIKDYPQGSYTANAYYWLGEVLLVESRPSDAQKAFETLLAQYPAHRKVPDAKYKLAKIHLQQGDTQQAKTLFQDVIKQYAGSTAAKLSEAEMRGAQL